MTDPTTGRASDPRADVPRHHLYEELSRRPGRPGLTRVLSEAGRAFVGNDLPRRLSEAAERAQRDVPTGRRITLLGAVGGSGTTSTVVALARTLCALRDDPLGVAARDPDLGALRERLGLVDGPDATTVLARLDGAEAVTSDVAAFADARQRLHAVPGGSRTDEEADRLLTRMSRTFRITLMDGGRALLTGQGPGQPHVVALVAPVGLVGDRAVRSITRAWESSGVPVVTRVVLVDRDRDRSVVLGREADALAHAGHTVSVIPHDAHLRGGARVEHRLLAARTQVAVAELAADLLGDALGAGRGR